ncbi:hypothetical protein [Citrobacter meridianamericanus]|uniref:hypothetical protein n=1 Tax=Citrobacter meridianamericanus TaxID=2894201 RepID=UPI0039BE808E
MKQHLAGIICLLLLAGCTRQEVFTGPDVLILPVSGSVLSPDNPCVTDFAALRDFNPATYSTYREQFDEINRVYAMYQQDVINLGKDPKELLSMELEAKLNQVCTRVKYSVYITVQKNLSPVNGL